MMGQGHAGPLAPCPHRSQPPSGASLLTSGRLRTLAASHGDAQGTSHESLTPASSGLGGNTEVISQPRGRTRPRAGPGSVQEAGPVRVAMVGHQANHL